MTLTLTLNPNPSPTPNPYPTPPVTLSLTPTPNPKVALSTPALFRDRAAAAKEGAAKEGASPEALLRALQAGEAGGDNQRLPAGETAYVNDLHAAALRCSREVAAVAARLSEFSRSVRKN